MLLGIKYKENIIKKPSNNRENRDMTYTHINCLREYGFTKKKKKDNSNSEYLSLLRSLFLFSGTNNTYLLVFLIFIFSVSKESHQ